MLGLPSTTAVNRRLPKEAFYTRLKVSETVRRSFIDDVERIEVAHSVKPATIGILDGQKIHEILVLEVLLKAKHVPCDVLTLIANTNPHKIIFACTYEDDVCLAVWLQKLHVGPWTQMHAATLNIEALDMDHAWDTMASQIAYGDTGIQDVTVEERVAKDARLAAKRDELAKLEKRMRKEPQHGRKNELFDQAKRLRQEMLNEFGTL